MSAAQEFYAFVVIGGTASLVIAWALLALGDAIGDLIVQRARRSSATTPRGRNTR